MQQHSQTTGIIDVERFNDHDKPPRRFAPGRVCGDDHCGTHLSIYNDGYFCTLHAPVVAPRVRVRRSFGLEGRGPGRLRRFVSEAPNRENSGRPVPGRSRACGAGLRWLSANSLPSSGTGTLPV
jgi:hypothetical protein